MGLENPIHLMIVLVVVLMVFGAKRLPEMGRSLGDGMRGFKEAISGQAPPTQAMTVQPAPVVQPATVMAARSETPIGSVEPVAVSVSDDAAVGV